MILDIIVAVILLLAIIYGFRKGFIFTLVHSVGWIAAIVGAYFLTPKTSTFLKAHTGLGDWIEALVVKHFDTSLGNMGEANNSVPLAIKNSLQQGQDINELTSVFAQILVTLISFLVVFLVLKILLGLLLLLISKDYCGGFVHIVDGLLGGIFGLLTGAAIVVVLLILLVPMSNIFSAELSSSIATQMESSHFVGNLYNNNALLILLQNFVL